MTQLPYGGQPPGQYPQQYPQQYGYPQRTNTLAILALVFAFLFWPAAIVFGHVARGQIRRTHESGSGLALAGLIISYIFLAMTVLVVIGVIIAAANAPSSGVSNALGALVL